MKEEIMIVEKYDCLDDSMLFRAKLDGKYGYINSREEVVIPCVYDAADKFIDNIATVEKNGLMGVVNKEGKEVVPCEYDCITMCNGGLLLVYRNKKWGILNSNGEQIVPCVYDKLSSFKNGVANAELAGEIGVVDVRGKAYFGEKAVEIVKKYNRNISQEKTIIQMMIENAKTKDEVMNAVLAGKKRINHERSQMAKALLGQQLNPEDVDSQLIKEAKESIKWF